MTRLIQYFVPVLAAAIAVGYEFNLIAPANAFFGAVATATVLFAGQLIVRDGMPIAAAANAVIRDPKAHGTPVAYWLFLGALAVSILVAVRIAAGL